MSSNVRLFPVLASVAAGAFAIKAVGLAESAGAATTRIVAASTADAAETYEETNEDSYDTESEDTHASNEADTCSPDYDIAEQAGLSQYEIQVLRSLGKRRDELESRERSVDTREQTLAAAELRLNDQIAELEVLESNIKVLLDQLDEKSEAEILALVKVYESMKPKDAARIFDTLDDKLMLQLGHRMKPANMAAILAKMSAERAKVLTQMMANKAELPETADDLRERVDGA